MLKGMTRRGAGETGKRHCKKYRQWQAQQAEGMKRIRQVSVGQAGRICTYLWVDFFYAKNADDGKLGRVQTRDRLTGIRGKFRWKNVMWVRQIAIKSEITSPG
jgi:hypothetical protein